MSLANTIQSLTASARKVHGSDISIMVARAIAFGNEDNLILVRGKNHLKVAADVARAVGKGAKITIEEGTEFMGRKSKYACVAF